MQGIPSTSEASQIRELTSVRGLASLVVLFGHIFIVINRHALNNSSQHDVFVNRAFDFLAEAFNGPAAVEIFENVTSPLKVSDEVNPVSSKNTRE